MFDAEIRGLEDLERLGRELRQAGDGGKELRRELYRGLNSVTKEVRGGMREAIPAALPQRGGLARTIQSSARFTTSPKLAGKFLGVTIWGKAKGHDLRLLTGRRLRHPVFGNRRVWVNQSKGVDPAVFVGKFEDQKPEVRDAILDVISRVRAKLYRSV